MYPRAEYELSEDELAEILDACKPTPCIMVGGYGPSSPQENANRAWAALGKKLGFDPMSVRPIKGKGQRFVTAIPSETEDQREERLAREKEQAKTEKINNLCSKRDGIIAEIADLQDGDCEAK